MNNYPNLIFWSFDSLDKIFKIFLVHLNDFQLKAGGKPSTWFPPGGTRRAGLLNSPIDEIQIWETICTHPNQIHASNLPPCFPSFWHDSIWLDGKGSERSRPMHSDSPMIQKHFSSDMHFFGFDNFCFVLSGRGFIVFFPKYSICQKTSHSNLEFVFEIAACWKNRVRTLHLESTFNAVPNNAAGNFIHNIKKLLIFRQCLKMLNLTTFTTFTDMNELPG